MATKTASPSQPVKLPQPLARELEATYVARQKAKIQKAQKDKLAQSPVPINPDAYRAFSDHLKSSKRVVALIGAGLSVSSGISTFSGLGSFWRDRTIRSLASDGTFAEDPNLVWWHDAVRRSEALNAQPSPGHYAIADLANKLGDGMLTVCQNIDDLCPRAGQPDAHTVYIHGTIFKAKCSSKTCSYIRHDTEDPIVPSLTVSEKISDPSQPLPQIPVESLPTCPLCSSLLRLAVVHMGETLDTGMMRKIHDWMGAAPDLLNKDKDQSVDEIKPIDLILVVGTSAQVYPAAGLLDEARKRGARACIINPDPESANVIGGMREGDWWFGAPVEDEFAALLKQTVDEM